MATYPHPATVPLLLSEALELLIADTERKVSTGGRSPHTLVMHVTHQRWLLEQLGPELAIDLVNEPFLEDFAIRALRSGGRDGGSLSPKTVQKRLSSLRRALAVAVRRRRLDRMPLFPEWGGAPIPPVELRILTFAHFEAIRAELRPHRREWIDLCFWTVQRSSDLERMTWNDVGLEDARPWIRIRSTKTRRPFGIRVHCPVPLLEVLRAMWGRSVLRGKAPTKETRLLKPWKNRSYDLGRASMRAGFQPITATHIKHFATSAMVRRTGITVAAQTWVGWRDLKMMQSVYAHALPPQLAEVAHELETFAAESDEKGGGKP